MTQSASAAGFLSVLAVCSLCYAQSDVAKVGHRYTKVQGGPQQKGVRTAGLVLLQQTQTAEMDN